MLFCLPWLVFCCGDRAYGQSIKLAMRLLELPIHKADAFNKAGDVSAGGFGRSGRDMQRRLAQHVQNIGRIEAPDAIALQKLDNRRFADALALPGVGASSHSSSSQGAPRSLSMSSMAGK